MKNNYKKILNNILKKKNNWLITGVAGFIGSNILEVLLSNNQNVIGIDNFSSGRKKNIFKHLKNNKNFLFIKSDINKLKYDTFKNKNINYIIHLAAMTSVSNSIKKPKKCYKNNVDGFNNLLRCIIKIKSLKKIIYASSAAVYGNNNKKNSEKSKLNPLSPYAISKIENEKLAKFYSNKSHINFTGFRFFNIFGKNQDPKSQYSSVISKWIYQLKNNQKINIYGNGLTTRDFCSIDNVVFFLLMSLKKKINKNEIFNLACGNSITLNKLAKILIFNIKKNKNFSKFVQYKKFKKGDIYKSRADISKIKEKIYAKVPFKTAKSLKNLI